MYLKHKRMVGPHKKIHLKYYFMQSFCLLVGFSLNARLKYFGRSIPSVLPAVSKTPFSDQKNSMPSKETQTHIKILHVQKRFNILSCRQLNEQIYLPVLWGRQQTQQDHSPSSCLETITKTIKVEMFVQPLSNTYVHTITRGYH